MYVTAYWVEILFNLSKLTIFDDFKIFDISFDYPSEIYIVVGRRKEIGKCDSKKRG